MCRALGVLFNNIEDTCHTSELNSTSILYTYFPRKTFKLITDIELNFDYK